MSKEERNLLEGDIKKTFLKYLLPAVGGMLGTSLYVIGDTMVVGRGLGSQGLAALNVGIPINNVFNGMGLLFGIGGATALAINKGRQDEEEVNDIFSKSMIMAVMVGIILTLVRVFFLEHFAKLLGASDNTLAISAYSIIANLSAAIFTGVGQAVQPIVSYSFGAKEMDRVYETVRFAIYTSLGLGIIFYSLGLFIPESLVSIFIDSEPELLAITVRGIRLYFLTFILMGFNIVLTSFIQSKEDGRASFTISLLRGFILVIAILFILPRIIGIDGVWLALPLVELLTSIFSFFYFKKYGRAVRYTIENI